jgi:hypothetical protein
MKFTNVVSTIALVFTMALAVNAAPAPAPAPAGEQLSYASYASNVLTAIILIAEAKAEPCRLYDFYCHAGW